MYTHVYQFSRNVCVCGSGTLHFVNMLSLQKHTNKMEDGQRKKRVKLWRSRDRWSTIWREEWNWIISAIRVLTHTAITSALSHVSLNQTWIQSHESTPHHCCIQRLLIWKETHYDRNYYFCMTPTHPTRTFLFICQVWKKGTEKRRSVPTQMPV